MDGPFTLRLLCLLATLLIATPQSAGREVDDAALDEVNIIARNGFKDVEWGIKTSGSHKPVTSTSCQEMICKAGERCIMVNDKPKCVCNNVCTANKQPVCGTDRKTYSNMCWLNIQTCKSKGNVTLKHSGKCVLNLISGPRNCAEIEASGSGVFAIDPDGKGSFQVYCNLSIAGGGWTVIQRRQDGSVNFWRNWQDYKTGFGNLNGEFWLGLDKIHRLTQQSKNILRIDMVYRWPIKRQFAQYDFFAVSTEQTRYTLRVGRHSGTARDGLTYHNGQPFSTKDRDNDACKCNCAIDYKGGWWYKRCIDSNPNGADWKVTRIRQSEMKIRPQR